MHDNFKLTTMSTGPLSTPRRFARTSHLLSGTPVTVANAGTNVPGSGEYAESSGCLV